MATFWLILALLTQVSNLTTSTTTKRFTLSDPANPAALGGDDGNGRLADRRVVR